MTNASTAQSREPIDTPETDAAMFFPTEGTFSPVVPLSKINESLELSDASGEPATEEQEDTLVPLRVSHATETRETRALTQTRPRSILRPKSVRQSWPVTVIAIALSVIAGLIAGAYLVGFRQPAGTLGAAPLAVDATHATVDATPLTEVATQAPEPQPATATSDTQASTATVTSNPQASQPATTPAPPNSAPDTRREHASAPTARGVANADAHAERPTRTPSVERDLPATKPAQRDAATTTTVRRTRVAEERPTTPAPPKQSFPVSSPPPSAKSRKVIQWP
ncbi:MAG: hypothetical protein QOH51_533 [Acidobacteriota bacterium]|nr:hypothetical protein [Acidobacteriota bacterium]